MNRKDSKEFLNELQKKNPNLKVYSYSKLTSGEECPYEAYLQYVMKHRGDTIYTLMGEVIHSLIEDYTNGVCTDNQEMLEKFNKAFNRNTLKYHFPTEKSKLSYHTNMENFFLNFDGLPKEFESYKVMTEQFILYSLSEDAIVQGFVDLYLVNPETEEFIVVDHKSSTKYTGKKLEKASWQLLLYAEGLKQLTGYKRYKIMWNFTKYANVTYKLKSGKFKNAVWERKDMIDKMWNEISKRWKTEPDTMKLLKLKRDFYTKQIFDDELLTHPLELSFSDAYVEYEIPEDVEQKVNDWLISKVNQFEDRMKKGEDAFPPIKIHDRKDGEGLPFHCSKLCMHKDKCPHYQKLKNKIIKELDKE